MLFSILNYVVRKTAMIYCGFTYISGPLRFYFDHLGSYQTPSDDDISTFNVLLYFLFNIFQVEFGLSVCGISRTDSSVFPGGDDSRNICLPNAFWLVLYFDLFFTCSVFLSLIYLFVFYQPFNHI